MNNELLADLQEEYIFYPFEKSVNYNVLVSVDIVAMVTNKSTYGHWEA